MQLHTYFFLLLFFSSLNTMDTPPEEKKDVESLSDSGGFSIRNIDADHPVFMQAYVDVVVDYEERCDIEGNESYLQPIIEKKVILETIALRPNAEIFFSKEFLKEKEINKLNVEVLSMYPDINEPTIRESSYTISIPTPPTFRKNELFNVVNGVRLFVYDQQDETNANPNGNFTGFYVRTLLRDKRTDTPLNPFAIREQDKLVQSTTNEHNPDATPRSKPSIKNIPFTDSYEKQSVERLRGRSNSNKKTSVSCH